MISPETEKEEVILQDILNEARRAFRLHGPYNSHHEAYAVILEELEEYWEEVRKKSEERDPVAMRKELIQLAQTAFRTIYDLIDRVER